MMILKNTPIEMYNGILVKREDLAADPPAPPFSKLRGVVPHLEGLKEQGIRTVGYTETSISMAGWGVAWACQQIGLKAIIFDPIYKHTPPLLAMHRKQWAKFPDTTIVPIKAGMAKVNWYISRNLLKTYDSQGVLLPLGLPFHETIEATAIEMALTQESTNFRTVVVNVGSGTIAAGLWKGLKKGKGLLYGIMGRSGFVPKKLESISKKSTCLNGGFFGSPWKMKLVDPGWEYTTPSKAYSPFPCHPFYDLKAWQWLVENESILEHPVLFWNIGRVK